MEADSSIEPLVALLGSLSVASPSELLERLDQGLNAIGLGLTGAGESAWLSVEVEGQRLAVAAPSEQRLEVPAALVRSVLVAAARRLADAAERERLHEHFEMLSSASFEGILLHVDGRVIAANRRLTELFGCEMADLMGPQGVLAFVAPEDLPITLRRFRERAEGSFLATARRKDGSRFRIEVSTKQSTVGDKAVRVVALRDVTERERFLELLHENERSLHELLTASFDVFVVAHDNLIVEIGGRVAELLGRSEGELIGKNVFEFLAPSVHESTRKRLSEGRTGAYESVVIGRSGEHIPVEICGVLAQRGGQMARVAGLRDLRPLQRLEAERLKLQQQLERSQRLESLGVLAGGIAHDFNNLLVAIIGNADLLYSMLPEPDDRDCALAIRSAGERAAELIRQMLAYAGQRDPVRRDPVDLTVRLRELSQLLAATLSKKAELELSLEPGCVVSGDSASLSQVLMNLLTNASDALSDRPGKIGLNIRHVETPDARWDDALGAAIHPGRWVLIEVTDTGMGMDEATRGRVFEPFFTTKPRGHGLGLAACLGIVRSHDGAILVESEPERGSRFSVLLPAAEPVAAQREAGAASPLQSAGRVLVVDDEQAVRAHLRRALSLRGYSVHEADCGSAGVAAALAEPFDVIVLDLTMNDMDGLEVIRRVRQDGCRVPIVLSSGYFDAEAERELEPHSIQAFLRKPYLISDLLAALERARAQGRPA
ncbi:MAG TPA: ATP-binding protein [Polyangiaceae bacterium]|nr:ATP-binding protein [Polyangiaceae bacterium]